MSLCLIRLQEERKQWRKTHPFGFFAKPNKASDGSLDLKHWTAGIPGKEGTIWEGAVYLNSLMNILLNHQRSSSDQSFIIRMYTLVGLCV